jgi:hypothetical protein
MSDTIVSKTYTLFNASTGPYNRYLKAWAEEMGLGCSIITLRLGNFRSTYHMTIRGEPATVQQYFLQVVRY